MNKIGKEMMTRDLLQFRFYTEEELVRMYMDALEVIDNLQSKIDKTVEYLRKNNVSLNELTKNFEIIPTNMILIEFLKGKREDIESEEDKIQEIPQFKGTMEQLDELCDIRKE